MTPAVGLLKLIEMGMEKGGLRDSMATRQANRAGEAMQMANQPLMSPVDTGGPFSQPAPQMSPVMPQLTDTSPDTFDKIMNVVGMLGPGGTMQGGAPQALNGPAVPNMGMTAQDMMQNNQGGGGLLTIMKLMGMGA